VLIGLLAASGVAMAFIVVFGMFDSVAYSLVWRVFVADLYLIASLAAQHRWLRLTAWIGTGVTFLLGMVNVFWRFTPYWQWADGRDYYTVGDPRTGWSPWFGFEESLEYAAHLVLVGVVVLGFVSLAYRWVAGERVLRAVYVFTFAAGLLSVLLGAVLILDSPYRMGLDEWVGQLQAGITILALTAAAIVTIAAFVLRRAARSAERAGIPGIPGTAGSFAEQQRLAAVAQAAGAAAPLRASGTGSQAPQAPHTEGALATLTPDELRALVRRYVDDYLAERER
jgi:hypothetical protein